MTLLKGNYRMGVRMMQMNPFHLTVLWNSCLATYRIRYDMTVDRWVVTAHLTHFIPFQTTIFNDDLQTLVLSFFKQGIMKQVLTEGERYVMSMSPILTFHQQATYDIVNNLGSLFARFVFRPIEENSYFYFTQTILRDVPLAKQKRVSETLLSLIAR